MILAWVHMHPGEVLKEGAGQHGQALCGQSIGHFCGSQFATLKMLPLHMPTCVQVGAGGAIAKVLGLKSSNNSGACLQGVEGWDYVRKRWLGEGHGGR